MTLQKNNQFKKKSSEIVYNQHEGAYKSKCWVYKETHKVCKERKGNLQRQNGGMQRNTLGSGGYKKIYHGSNKAVSSGSL